MSCPNCGYCPHCGRSNPQQPFSAPNPFQQPTITWGGFTGGLQYQNTPLTTPPTTGVVTFKENA